MTNRPTPPEMAFRCPKSWAEMKGDDQKRFCEHCNLHVHNLSAMTRREGQSLLIRGGAQSCVIYTSRADGSMVTASRWRWLSRSSSTLRRGIAALLAVTAPVFFATYVQARPRHKSHAATQQKDAARSIPDAPQVTMGMVAIKAPTPAPKVEGETHTMGKPAVPRSDKDCPANGK